MGPFLNRRLAFFFEPGSFEDFVGHIFDVYKENKVTLGPKFLSTHLRTITNHWCTNRRFGRDSAECPFGCNAGHDGITHALLCPRFQSEVQLVLRLPANALTLHGLLLFIADGACVHSLVASKILIYVYLCFNAHNSCRHGKKLNTRLVRFLMRHLILRNPRIQKFVVRFRNR